MIRGKKTHARNRHDAPKKNFGIHWRKLLNLPRKIPDGSLKSQGKILDKIPSKMFPQQFLPIQVPPPPMLVCQMGSKWVITKRQKHRLAVLLQQRRPLGVHHLVLQVFNWHATLAPIALHGVGFVETYMCNLEKKRQKKTQRSTLHFEQIIFLSLSGDHLTIGLLEKSKALLTNPLGEGGHFLFPKTPGGFKPTTDIRKYETRWCWVPSKSMR